MAIVSVNESPAPAAAPPSSGRRSRRRRAAGGRSTSQLRTPIWTASCAAEQRELRAIEVAGALELRRREVAVHVDVGRGEHAAGPEQQHRQLSGGESGDQRDGPATAHAAGGYGPEPMRIAVLSDVHGNRHAFEAVLEDVARHDVRRIWCLGDLVGYGADPDACVELAIARHRAMPGAATTTSPCAGTSRSRSSPAAPSSPRAGPRR